LNTDPVRSTAEGLPFQIVALVVLVLLAAFFAASESALVSISRLRARAIAERKVRGGHDLEQLVTDKNRFLTSMLVGNTIVLLAADSLATYVAISLNLPSAAVISTIAMTVVFLLFGEIVPKTIATGDSERWALRLAVPMRYTAYVLTPIARTFQVVTDWLLRLFRIKHAHAVYVTEEDIRTLVNVGAEQRVIEEQERELIHSVMEFGDTIVREVMKPRPEMVAVSVDDSPRRVLDVVIAEGYSKLPVYQESKDDIVGVIHDRELLIALANGSLAHASVRRLMRPAVHLPETKKIAELLREMQRDKFSLAIIVDEYGGTAGLVTMEDLLEEIVGEIRDEHDTDEQEPISVVSEREAVVEAGTNIEDVNAKLGIELPTEDFETLGGYTVGLFGRLPTEGEEIEADDHTRLRVDRTRGRRILTVRVYTNGSITRAPSEDPDAAAHL
jgi:putative hemolysin